jgi:hypothetical protein
MAFVVVTKSWVEGFEDLKLGDITGWVFCLSFRVLSHRQDLGLAKCSVSWR